MGKRVAHTRRREIHKAFRLRNFEGWSPLVSRRCRWKNNTKIELQQISEGLTVMILARIETSFWLF